MSTNKKQPTILDIAKAAGVSKSTVSLALRNSPLAKNETREKIQKIAEEMGYRPNMLFSIMGSGNRRKKHSTDRVGVAYLYDYGQTRNKDLMNLEFLQKMADDQGFFVEGFDLHKEKSPRKFVDMLYYRGFAGVILGHIVDPDSIGYDLELSDFSVVCQGGQFRRHGFNRVREDFFVGIRQCWSALRKAGYKRIAIAPSRHPEHFWDDDYRLGSALVCMDETSKDERIPPFTGDHRDYDGFIKWVKDHKADAVIAFQAGHYWQLKDAGFKIPEKLGYMQLIVSSENNENDQLSGLWDTREASCFNTLSLMNQLIRNRIRGMPDMPVTVIVQPEWNEGESYKK